MPDQRPQMWKQHSGQPDLVESTDGHLLGAASEAEAAEFVEQLNTLEADLQAAREALEELLDAEWMVTPDWSSSADRDEVITKARTVLSRLSSPRAREGDEG